MSTFDHKREWAQDAARHHLRELRRDGMPWKELSDLLGFSRVYLDRVIRDQNPVPVSKNLWNALIEKAGFAPTPGMVQSADMQRIKDTPANSIESAVLALVADMGRIKARLDRIEGTMDQLRSEMEALRSRAMPSGRAS